MSPGPELRLVLPHQLFDQHLDAAAGTVFVLIEHDLMFRQYSFHAQKLVLHRATMTRFARRLRGRGFEVEVLASDAGRPSNAQLAELVRSRRPSRVTWSDRSSTIIGAGSDHQWLKKEKAESHGGVAGMLERPRTSSPAAGTSTTGLPGKPHACTTSMCGSAAGWTS